MPAISDPISLGVFAGPWDTGHVARDGAVIGFSDAQQAVRRLLGTQGARGFRLVELEPSIFLADDLAGRLRGLDVVFANCGPLTAFLFAVRAREGLDFSIIREVRTLGWIGYAFQEYVACALQRPEDVCVHVSEFCKQTWRGVRGDCNDLVYYPMLWAEPKARPSAPPEGRKLRCGFFSRLSRDKGLALVPDILAKLQRAGWPIGSLDMCGNGADPALLERVTARLGALGVMPISHGEVDYRRTAALMEGVDIVLFPSVSSYESFGRVVAEAYNLGKTTVASDFCAGRDLLAPAFRIPLSRPVAAMGAADEPFALGRLAVEEWQVPAWSDDNYRRDNCERYRFSADALLAVLERGTGPDARHADRGGAHGGGDGTGTDGHYLGMEFDWGPVAGLSAEAWCAAVRERLTATVRSRQDLLDLGGAMKRSILEAGFRPTVAFYER